MNEQITIASAPVGAIAPTPVPDFIPEKFRNAADPIKALADSYAELEKKGVQQSPPPPPAPAVEPKPGETPAAEGPLAPFFKEFSEAGTLKAESYEALAKIGLPKEVVDAYISGETTKASIAQATIAADLHSATGGAEAYDAVLTWGAANLSEPEKAAYDAALGKNDIVGAKAMMATFKGKYDAAMGTDPARQIDGHGSKNTGGYATQAEMLHDQRSTRYQTDPAFRDSVVNRALRSKF